VAKDAFKNKVTLDSSQQLLLALSLNGKQMTPDYFYENGLVNYNADFTKPGIYSVEI
jgi:hypothetical protein